MSAGINRRTGQPLAGWPHCRQSLIVIFTTRIGARIMRRLFGFAGLGLLGRENLTPAVMMRWYMAVVIAVELWEPRYRVTSLIFPKAGNSPSQLRQGQIGLTLNGEFMPNALEGDFTVASAQSFGL
jgi:phage baseplate assembly protein W